MLGRRPVVPRSACLLFLGLNSVSFFHLLIHCDISRSLTTEEEGQCGHQDTQTNSSGHRRDQGEDVSKVVPALTVSLRQSEEPTSVTAG